jgi:aldehyde:ferredoxin oxidoreductase
MNSYSPKLLRVNLSSATLGEEAVPQSTVNQFVGGRGFGVKYLYQELSPGIEPLSPANKLIFTIGPLAGTGALSFSRWIVTTKSPLTGTYFRSVGGADFGAWLRFAGLDMIIVEGKAPEPVYLYIEDGRYEVRDAGELWGKDTADTRRKLKEVHGERVRAACIGPAGERLVRYASILSDRRTAGRGGVGAVMGAKNLKAIAIKANHKVNLPKPEEFRALIKEQAAGSNADPSIHVYRANGTLGTVQAANVSGIFPTRNFREGTLGGWEKVSAAEYARIRVKDHGCYGCPVRCGKIHLVPTGPYAGATNEGPEYETVWAFTASIGSTDIGATVVADTLCDDLGMDTISTGSAIGFAYELFEKGIISLKDTGGLNLVYGNYEAAIELVKRIGNRQGFGDVLAEGTRRAASHIGKGAEAYAMEIKGLELAGYEPRGAKRHGLGFATSTIGGSHNIGYLGQEIYGTTRPRPIDRFADEGDTDLLKLVQDRAAMWETGIACSFAQPRMRVFAPMLVSVTGIPELGSVERLFAVGERIYNLERVFNIREGFGRKDDAFPMRMTTEPLRNAGPAEGQVLRKPDTLLDEYYRFRGWDENGVPTGDKLKELSLDEIINDIGG